ncbi:dna modification methylase [hydrocarbon metagenome]|uniref:Dna modification methylase n=2 Tax=root TaxID=1 RepID=A0A0W8F8F1_9ZZZZ
MIIISVGEAFRNHYRDEEPSEQVDLQGQPLYKALADAIPVYCAHDKIIDIIEAIPNPRNPNQHPDSQIELLARIIKAQGWRNPIVISKLSGFITKGHGRLLAAQKLGVKQIPVDYQDYANPAAEWADIIADNKIAELATPDNKLIKEILDEIRGDIDLDLTGYAGVQMDQLLKDIKKHDDKFRPGETNSRPKIDFIEDEKRALEVPAEDAHLFEGKKNVVVIFSGGIDSTFSLFWAKQNFGDRRVIGIFSDPGVELPGAALHAYQVCMYLEVEFVLVKPKSDMFIEMVKRGGWPSTIFPWCQSDFVYGPINDWILANLEAHETVVMDGSSGDQVTRLSKKTKTSKSTEKRMHEYAYYHPRYDVSREASEKILKHAGVPFWWGYEMGAKRTACWMCPGMKGEQALFIQERFPGLADYVRKMEKYMGKPLEQMNDKSFDMKVEIGKRQAARRAKGEALEAEEDYKIVADAQDS